VDRNDHLRGAHGGLSKLHPQVSEILRGTFGALATPSVLDYQRYLGKRSSL
jgi:pullulanase/glycogen debranching enzyme